MSGGPPHPAAAVRRWLERSARRIARHLVGDPATFVYSSSYVFQIPGAAADARRPEDILTFLADEDLIPRGTLLWPRPASFADLRLVHTDAYLEELRAPGALTRIVGQRLSDFEEEKVLDLQRAMVGGTLLATRTVLARRGIAVNLGGGLHHAHADRGQGFCIFNDVAITIRRVREDGFRGRVLVVDLDLHDGDGNRALFADDESVHTFSIHNRHWAATGGAVESTAVALGDQVEDRTYLDALAEHLPPVVRRFQPELIVYLAGVDPAATDGIGDWRITPAAMLERDRFVFEAVRRAGEPPLVITLAGGYGPRAWSYSARFFAWLLTGGKTIEPPSREEITLERYRKLRELVSPTCLTGEPDPAEDEDSFGITEEDVFGQLTGRRTESRLLGYYSKTGLEHALERFGLLARLREKGFPHPTLELELDNPIGQTLKIFGDVDRKDLLVETRLRRDRHEVPDCELLRVEWLLLQDPRKPVDGPRPPLPGQKHPGLGLLRDAASLLVLMCERLGLDGILFVPAHYHLAAQASGLLRFVEPEAAARFEALRDAVGDLPLGEATRAVDAQKVLDEATGEPVTWEPSPMVIPVSERLARRLASDDATQRRREARARLSYRSSR